jgi:membrane protease YdiL (CAAX protease family)
MGPAVLMLVILAAAAALSGPGGALAGSGEAFFSLATPTGVATALLIQAGSLALVWLFAGWGGARQPVLRLGEERFAPGLYVAGAALLIGLTGILELLLYTTFEIDIFADTAWLRDGLNSPLALGTALIAVVLAPLWEELTFRGFLLSALAQTPLGFWGGAVVANVLWTALHGMYSWAGLASVFTAGLILSWLVWRTGSIKPAIVAHAAGNLAALSFTYAFAPV